MFHPKVTKVQKVKVSDSQIEEDPVEKSESSDSDTTPPPQKITKEQGWNWNVTGDYYYYYYYYWYSALGPVWAETRTQSGDWYGSGTLHPGQVLRGSFAIAFPRFLDVPTFHHQVPPRPPRRERSQRRKWELWARMLSGHFA